MALPISKGAEGRILHLIKVFKIVQKAKAVGMQKLTRAEIDYLIKSGAYKNIGLLQAPIVEAYLGTHEQASIADPAPKAVRDGAIDFLTRTMERYYDKAADQLSSEVLSTIEHTLFPIQNRKEGRVIYEALADKNVHKLDLKNLLKERVDAWEFRYKTIVKTELNRASNWGSMDAIINNNPTKSPEQIAVYKTGALPGQGSCDVCAKLWYQPDGITPKTYKLSELLENGTNMGKKKADWKATVDSTHPNESHLLHELSPGYGFGSDGYAKWMGDEHDEYKHQRNK